MASHDHEESMDVNESEEKTAKKVKFDESNNEEKPERPKVFLPRILEAGEEWEMDQSAYRMYHPAQTDSPCLSFDIIPDGFGNNRTEFPLTAYIVAGTQADRSRNNSIIIMKMTNLTKTKPDESDDDDSDSSESDDEDDDENDPIMLTAKIPHNGCVNRIRANELGGTIYAASWSEHGKVNIWDLKAPLRAVDDAQAMVSYIQNPKPPKPVFTFSGHRTEGYAIDWSSKHCGYLATGDCDKNIHVWKPQEGGSWHVDQRPYSSHTASVEDLQWSPTEQNLLASCSVDKSIRVWDIREQQNKACILTMKNAHASDVNVISWSQTDPFIISGGDDGVIKVWDVRGLQAVATFKHHSGPITSVEWNPNESCVFAASGGDDQITLWDLSLEKDGRGERMVEEAEDDEEKVVSNLPAQLLFIHQGQNEIKELHWHSQLPGVVISTANSGFNIFRTINV